MEICDEVFFYRLHDSGLHGAKWILGRTWGIAVLHFGDRGSECFYCGNEPKGRHAEDLLLQGLSKVLSASSCTGLREVCLYINVSPCFYCCNIICKFLENQRSRNNRLMMQVVFASPYRWIRSSCEENQCESSPDNRHDLPSRKDHEKQIKGLQKLYHKPGMNLRTTDAKDWRLLAKNLAVPNCDFESRREEDTNFRKDFHQALGLQNEGESSEEHVTQEHHEPFSEMGLNLQLRNIGAEDKDIRKPRGWLQSTPEQQEDCTTSLHDFGVDQRMLPDSSARNRGDTPPHEPPRRLHQPPRRQVQPTPTQNEKLTPTNFGTTTSATNFGTRTSATNFGTTTSATNFGTTSATNFGTTTSATDCDIMTSATDCDIMTSPTDFDTMTSPTDFDTMTSAADFDITTDNEVHGESSEEHVTQEHHEPFREMGFNLHLRNIGAEDKDIRKPRGHLQSTPEQQEDCTTSLYDFGVNRTMPSDSSAKNRGDTPPHEPPPPLHQPPRRQLQPTPTQNEKLTPTNFDTMTDNEVHGRAAIRNGQKKEVAGNATCGLPMRVVPPDRDNNEAKSSYPDMQALERPGRAAILCGQEKEVGNDAACGPPINETLGAFGNTTDSDPSYIVDLGTKEGVCSSLKCVVPPGGDNKAQINYPDVCLEVPGRFGPIKIKRKTWIK